MELNISKIISILKDSHLFLDANFDPDNLELKITNIKSLDESSENDISFLNSFKQNLVSLAQNSKAGLILVPEISKEIQAPQISCKNPMAAVIILGEIFYQKPKLDNCIHPTAIIGENCEISPTAKIGAYVVIGNNVKIGDNTQVFSHCVVYDNVEIANNCTLHSGAVVRENTILEEDVILQNGAIIGGDGFGYIPDKVLGHRRIPHVGSAIIKKNVEIGANSTVDRATLGSTIIGTNTKIDNLVMIGHNVKVGERTLLCGQVGISGSSKVGNDVILAGQVGVADHRIIGNNVKVGGKSAVTQNLEDNMEVQGAPCIPAKEWLKVLSVLKKIGKNPAKILKLFQD